MREQYFMNLKKSRDRILLVDDDPVNLFVLTRSLRVAGFATVSAANGEAALKLIEAEEFDAVVTDVRMPRVNGIELLQNIRARLPLLPVILMTGLVEDDIREAASTWGATALFQKPVDRTDLILAIRILPHEPTEFSTDCEFHRSVEAAA